MSNSVFAKKSGVILAFVLFSFIFLGIIFSLTSDLSVKAGNEFSYSSWLIIAYVAGLSMIILPCTLPLVFIIIPLSMGKGYKKGLGMAMLFGAGLITTITLYGLGVGVIGKTASLDQFSTINCGGMYTSSTFKSKFFRIFAAPLPVTNFVDMFSKLFAIAMSLVT